MLDEKSPSRENVGNINAGESSMDPDNAVDRLSVSLQSCEPFCTSDVNSSTSLVGQDTLRTDEIVCHLNSFSIAGLSEEKYGEAENNISCNNASETKCPDKICSSRRRRSTGMNATMQKNGSERAVRKGRRSGKKNLSSDLISSEVTRRRRSCLCKSPRLSEWGSLRNVFTCDADQTGNHVIHKTNSFQGVGNRNKNKSNPFSQRPKEEIYFPTGRIRLKIKLGKEMGQNIVIENDGKSFGETGMEASGSPKDVEGKFEEDIPGGARGQPCNTHTKNPSVLDVVHLADKDITENENGKNGDDHDGIPGQKEVDILTLAVDNRCSDPGTSPDSEVINAIPEGQFSGKVLDDILVAAPEGIATGAFTCSNRPQPITAKGRKLENDSYSSGASVSTTTENACLNTSTSEVLSIQPMPSLGVVDMGISTENDLGVSNIVNGTEDNHKSSESKVLEKALPFPKPKGQSSRTTKSRSEAPQSLRSKGNSSAQKGNRSKHKAREKGDGVQVFPEVENCSQTGNHTLNDLQGIKTECSRTTHVTGLEMVPRGVTDQCVPQQNAWVSCDNCNKWRRISAALADYIEETKIRWICKDNLDKIFSDCSIPQEKSNAEINAELDISDVEEEASNNAFLSSNSSGKKQSTVSQQSSWKLIRSNLFLHRNRKTLTIDEIMVCHCKPPLGDQVGCGEGCLNRMLNIECVKGTCPCGELCSNNQFQRRKYAKLKCFRSGKKGYGLQLQEDIRKGQFLIEYVGEVLDMHAYEDRQREYALKGHKHFYFMTLNGGEVIDACAKGNLGRFINHSCEPNCRTEKWMVNGEVCIGLFTLRNIKKGEEVTFDYNYVRVFGAAAKRCVCGSSRCRGYIGGDPLNAEIIVQGDSDEEFLEPVMVPDDGDNNVSNIVSETSSVDVPETRAAEEDYTHQFTNVQNSEFPKDTHVPESLPKEMKGTVNSSDSSGFVDVSSRCEESSERALSGGACKESSIEMDSSVILLPSLQTIETLRQPDDGKSETSSAAQQESCVAKEELNKSLSTVQRSETSDLINNLSKPVVHTDDIERRSKVGPRDSRNVGSTSHPITNSSRTSSSIMKGKSKKSVRQVNKFVETGNRPHVVPHKPKKLMEVSTIDPFEAVQVKLNELLDTDGGISKRRDASRGYLKLLFLTAASGDSGNGEAIQSNRDLSMILDALLKTKSHKVLVDIISKNGLQMLHNIMKRCRKEFHKIPILRKLLKVLEYLAVKEILTLEHITSGPRCAGVESFRESILSLTEHDDKQVHQIARKFRDKWIPRHARKNNYVDRDAGRMDFHRGDSHRKMLSSLYTESCDLAGRPPEAIDCIKQPVGSATNGTRIRKRKSRWDQQILTNHDIGSPAHKEPRIQHTSMRKSHISPHREDRGVAFDHIADSTAEDKTLQRSIYVSTQQIGMENVLVGDQNNDDVPPGFSPLNGPLVSSNVSLSATCLHQENSFRSLSPCEVVIGHPQHRFISRLPVSYGVPLPAVQQFGSTAGATAEIWAVAVGIPFHPYPPLPPYPRVGRCAGPAASSLTVKNTAVKVEEGFQNPATHHLDHDTPSLSVANPLEIPVSTSQQNFQRKRNSSNWLDRKYFKQQKWKNSKPCPPWVRGGNFQENIGYHPKNGINFGGVDNGPNEAKVPYSSEQVNFGVMGCGNTLYQHQQHQN